MIFFDAYEVKFIPKLIQCINPHVYVMMWFNPLDSAHTSKGEIRK